MPGLKIPTIYVDDLVPASKKAVQEAVENVPNNVYVKIHKSDARGIPIVERAYITALKPGETQEYTDGKGKYYGRITRPLTGDGFILDGDPTSQQGTS